ncbi:MAG TPA: glucose-6-phosphate isomerase [Alphaproteobacteria bacterium]
MPYDHDISACFAARIGDGGLDEAEFEAALARTRPALARLRAWHADGSLPLLALPARSDDLAVLQPLIAEAGAKFDRLVVLGTGGSSLGGRTLAALAPQAAGRLHFADNIDPDGFEHLLGGLDLHRTLFAVISKSGGTAETMTQFLIAFEAVRAAVGEAGARGCFLLVTEPGDNPLRRLGARHKLALFDHDPGLGGRFSVLSLVGMIPALFAGVDALAVRKGAGQVLARTLEARDAAASEPARGAAVQVALAEARGVATTVLMPYCDRLGDFAMWFRQLWAESLGKGGKGTTPVRAIGAVDQHSQLQLYLDGPRDKLFTLVLLDQAGRGRRVEPELVAGEPALGYLSGRTMGDLFAAEQRATWDTLAARGRPVRVVRLDRLDARALGALLMHFMLETIIAAELWGVDPFDQPAVEDGKRRARQSLAGAAEVPA